MKRFAAIIMALIFLLSFSTVYAKDKIEVNGKSALLMEEESGEIIFSKNIKQKLPPASITKLMTYLITIGEVEKGKLTMEDMVTISKEAANEKGASYRLKPGEIVKLGDLVEAMMIVSANDAAFAIAEYVGGNIENFAKMMNEKAKEIGLDDSHFTNPNGLPKDKEHFMTAKDISTLAKYLIEHYKDEVLPLTDKAFFEKPEKNFYKENTNVLLKILPQVDGLKTGHTSEAGYCLVSTMNIKKKEEREKDFRLIAVVLGTGSEQKRVLESKKLLEYGEEYYTKKNILKLGEVVKKINLWGEKELPIQLLANEELWAFGLKEGIEKNREITLLDTMPFPIYKGQKLGEVKITLYNDKVIMTDLVSDRDVMYVSFGIFITRFWLILSGIFANLF